jgi:hypothetical protein
MPSFDDVRALAQLMPGRWTVKATNIPAWMSGERRESLLEFAPAGENPLTLSSLLSYTDPDGKSKTSRSRDRWNGAGFTRGGILSRSRWEVAGARQGLMVLRYEKSLATEAGVDVVVAEGVDATELRSVIAADPGSFGLSLEEFASLTWLDHLPPIG